MIEVGYRQKAEKTSKAFEYCIFNLAKYTIFKSYDDLFIKYYRIKSVFSSLIYYLFII